MLCLTFLFSSFSLMDCRYLSVWVFFIFFSICFSAAHFLFLMDFVYHALDIFHLRSLCVTSSTRSRRGVARRRPGGRCCGRIIERKWRVETINRRQSAFQRWKWRVHHPIMIAIVAVVGISSVTVTANRSTAALARRISSDVKCRPSVVLKCWSTQECDDGGSLTFFRGIGRRTRIWRWWCTWTRFVIGITWELLKRIIVVIVTFFRLSLFGLRFGLLLWFCRWDRQLVLFRFLEIILLIFVVSIFCTRILSRVIIFSLSWLWLRVRFALVFFLWFFHLLLFFVFLLFAECWWWIRDCECRRWWLLPASISYWCSASWLLSSCLRWRRFVNDDNCSIIVDTVWSCVWRRHFLFRWKIIIICDGWFLVKARKLEW